ncbi:hypothetical protein, partial [Bacillus pumilus]|uniref:hypothetical protein n=1 Tax=Bacillus pumilus TaxID=1408 RepID=UPI0016447112
VLSKRDDERGLALLDVLLGMAIFALIVVIGVQNFNTMRNRAYVTQAVSDAKQVGSSVMAAMTAPGALGGGMSAGVNIPEGHLTDDDLE